MRHVFLHRISLLLFALCMVSITVHGQQTTRLVFTPQWTPQSQFAGYYVAKAKGFYRDAGVNVDIVHPSASNPALNRLREGSSHVISLQLMQAIVKIDEGLPLINIMQTSQHNALLIVPRDNDIRTLQDLKDKKVGIWLAGFGDLARALDIKEKLGIHWIPFVNNINLFVSGAIDATLAMSYNEYLQILACGIRPGKVFYLSDLGYDIPEDGLYVTADYYRSHRRELNAFVEATKKGWEWAATHPDEALEIVMEEVRKHHVGTNRLIQKRMLETILKLQRSKPDIAPDFRLKSHQVEKATKILKESGFIHRNITFDEIIGRGYEN